MSDRTALITGGGTGIGRATALRLAEAGYQVALVGRTASSLDETGGLIRDRDRRCKPPLIIVADVASDGQARTIVDQVVAEWGRLDALINNAAMLGTAMIRDADRASVQSLFATNVFGPLALIASAWPAFERQESGCVVNISSAATMDPYPGLGLYGASKCALEGLTRAINNEGNSIGIRGFTIAPGAVETAMLRSLVSPAKLPSENILQPDDVARVVVDCVLGRRDAERHTVIRLART
jgi:NAD(P)-dependent dehydrogenase (short-subunit alcohol dehydrogenase family)